MEAIDGLEAHVAQGDALALAHLLRGELDRLRDVAVAVDVLEADRGAVCEELDRARRLLAVLCVEHDRADADGLVELGGAAADGISGHTRGRAGDAR